ncbi:hypothetical protein M0R19_07865 [Candidatus Pacearchaeota archaeon]|nr:hypothetical protein [Candidatus Pacearchaeota archaeon]
MTPEEKFNQNIWNTLERIKESELYTKIGDPVPVASLLIDKRALNKLEEWEAIKIRVNPWEYPVSTDLLFYLDIRPNFSQLYNKYKESVGKKIIKNVAKKSMNDNIIQFPIKDIRLDEQSYLLEINKSEKIVSFKSKRKGKGLEKETKLFKILFQLWDLRQEIKNGKIIEKGDFASLDNLLRGSTSENSTAVYKQIQRLNKRFEKEGLAIKIGGENGRYRLTINKI